MAALLLLSCIRETDNTPASSKVQPGDAWPVFSSDAFAGAAIGSDSLKGKTALLVFFSTDCADCRRELPAVEAVWEELKDDSRFIIVPIGRRQSAATIAAYWAERNWNMPFYPDPDGTIYALFATRTVPYFFAGTPDGIVRWIKAETSDREPGELIELLKGMAAAAEAY